ncbi:PREDICTED: beclin 1-associated autophagy-related key regulator-like isoform X3 [Branchiostoma belcheri]|uniref:Beclin 1-associated autophagy-related key regulator-like isoform X3 n=1 Tax=Branchiostoma belcheri TaxID=7741 RepID=A0A6P4YN32_BRABE|nr:PREDICTED: beclin 1-associated autophagy-related key regulator-like isoform X3 [Branchiostoma belcheri]
MAATDSNSDSSSSSNVLVDKQQLEAGSSSDSSDDLSAPVQKCPLCCSRTKRFTCKSCVNDGNFSRPDCSDSPARYSEKLQELSNWKRERLKLHARASDVVDSSKKVVSLRWEVLDHTSRLVALRKAVDEVEARKKEEYEQLSQLHEENRRRKHKELRHTEKLEKIQQYLSQIQAHVARQHEELEVRQEALVDVRRDNIRELTTSIFDIQDVAHTGDSEEDISESTVQQLAEARRTAYVRGRWVYTDINNDSQVCIVEPCLPANGNYSAYLDWMEANKEASIGPGDSDLDQRNPAYTFSAGLSHTTQLVKLLAFYLGVNLPKRICYSEFCGEPLSSSRFHRSVAKLNTNILHLCFTQNVSPELLHPMQTLRNIQALISSPDLGRCGAFDVNPEMIQSIEESLSTGASHAMDDSDDDRGVGADEHDISTDWETVPSAQLVEPHVEYVGESSTSTLVSHHRRTSQGVTVNMSTSPTGGLMSSAAETVASLWRTATGQGGNK